DDDADGPAGLLHLGGVGFKWVHGKASPPGGTGCARPYGRPAGSTRVKGPKPFATPERFSVRHRPASRPAIDGPRAPGRQHPTRWVPFRGRRPPLRRAAPRFEVCPTDFGSFVRLAAAKPRLPGAVFRIGSSQRAAARPIAAAGTGVAVDFDEVALLHEPTAMAPHTQQVRPAGRLGLPE